MADMIGVLVPQAPCSYPNYHFSLTQVVCRWRDIQRQSRDRLQRIVYVCLIERDRIFLQIGDIWLFVNSRAHNNIINMINNKSRVPMRVIIWNRTEDGSQRVIFSQLRPLQRLTKTNFTKCKIKSSQNVFFTWLAQDPFIKIISH